ncbi:MAG: electron transfer flavoprotein subunit beta, partial [Clostridiales bacterium]
IICGKMATDGDTAQVGPMLGEILDLPHITDISEIESIKENILICRKLTDDGYIRMKVQLPAVITVTKEINVPRLPSISGLLKGKDTEIPIYDSLSVKADKMMIGLAGSPTQVVRTFVPNTDLQSEIFQGTVAEKVDLLLQRLDENNILG